MKKLLSIFLSLGLGLFLAAGLVSLADDSLVLLFGFHLLTLPSGILSVLGCLMVILVYGLMGLTPMIPKRVFLPVTLFYIAGLLVVFPVLIYGYGWMLQVDWMLSLGQVILGLGLLWRLRGGWKFRWLIVGPEHLGTRGFSWLNLSVFVAVNILGVVPALLLYVALCAALAVDHFSGSFLALRPGGLTVQVRKYVRDDGKTIRLVPMAHIGEADFYRKVAESFPTNSIILMEGVTDWKRLITNEASYQRAAKSLGLKEQQEEFAPTRGERVMADMDVARFSTNTIGFINLVVFIHAKGLNAETLSALMRYTPPPGIEKQVMDDLLRRRNRHLLDEIRTRLPETENIIVPWGVAHMPELAQEIQKDGFRLDESQAYRVIRFHFIPAQPEPTPAPPRPD
jgi:hypothetical protein